MAFPVADLEIWLDVMNFLPSAFGRVIKHAERARLDCGLANVYFRTEFYLELERNKPCFLSTIVDDFND